jgi:hypothetical protein
MEDVSTRAMRETPAYEVIVVPLPGHSDPPFAVVDVVSHIALLSAQTWTLVGRGLVLT